MNSNKSIKYSSAQKYIIKPNTFQPIIFVDWIGSPIKYETLHFKSIEPVKIVMPPLLGFGYMMKWHPSCYVLKEMIYNKERDANVSFDRLDLILHDYELFIDSLGIRFHDNPIWLDRPDYCEYREAFDRSWRDLKYDLADSIEKLFIDRWKYLENNNRTFAPKLGEALGKMFPKVTSAGIDAIENELISYIEPEEY